MGVLIILLSADFDFGGFSYYSYGYVGCEFLVKFGMFWSLGYLLAVHVVVKIRRIQMLSIDDEIDFFFWS